MPEIILGLTVLLAGLYVLVRWLAGRVGTAPSRGRPLPRGQASGGHGQARAGSLGARLLGSPLARVGDPRLAATILMQQLVRSGSHVTAAETAQIMALMAAPLGIADAEAVYARAWGYSDARRAFAPVADELAPMLRRRLSADEAEQLVEMLLAVANAYSEASDLQLSNIARLRRRLGASEAERAW